MLDEIGLRGKQSDTYKLVNKLKEEVIDDNITLSSKFELQVPHNYKTLPRTNWFPKMQRTPARGRLIVASRKCCKSLCQRQLQRLLK